MKVDKSKDEDVRKKLIQELNKRIQELGREIQSDTSLTVEEKMIQVDVLLDIVRFLDNYKENTQVLNEYWINKYRELKWKLAGESEKRKDNR